MLCPVCLQDVTAFVDEEADGVPMLTCPHKDCGYNVPLTYRDDFATHPPLPFSLIGLTGHGKTVYKQSFLRHLHGIDNWPEFHFNWLDEIDVRNVRGEMIDLAEGRLPDATRGDTFQPPQILRLSHVPRLGGIQLLLFDTSGEVWRDAALIRSVGKYVRRSKCVVWLLSLDDMVSDVADLNDMLDIYLHALATMRVNPMDQSIVFALTKGDLLLNEQAFPEFPKSARDFLFTDELDPRGESWQQLETVSTDLEDWLGRSGYQKVVNTARNRFRAARYCVVSAQGMKATDQQMELEVMPRGVLAPLFWVWRLERPGVWVETDENRSLYFSLEEALNEAPEGATVRLEPGEHFTPGPLTLRKPVHLTGSGVDSTTLAIDAEKYAIGVSSEGHVTLSDLTLEPAGDDPVDVVRVIRGQFDAWDCRFRYGRVDSTTEHTTGSGLVLAGDSHGVISECIFFQNQRHGLVLRDRAAYRVENCKAVQNGIAGFYCESLGQTLLAANDSAANRHGIWAKGQASFQLEENYCHDNSKTGLRLESAQGVARSNRLEKNGQFGMQITGAGNVTAEKNQCDANGLHGIRIEDDNGGIIQENLCQANKQDGILIADTAHPTVDKNQCRRNGQHGIQITQSAAPACTENACQENTADGIHIESVAAPDLRGNQCDGNMNDGIAIVDQAKPIVEQNSCRSNGRYGLWFGKATRPKSAKRNTAEGNKGKTQINDQRPWLG